MNKNCPWYSSNPNHFETNKTNGIGVVNCHRFKENWKYKIYTKIRERYLWCCKQSVGHLSDWGFVKWFSASKK